MTAEIKLIVFDCDGVLVDSEVLAMRAYLDILADAGVSAPPDVWAECVGRKQADIFRQIERAAGKSVAPEFRERLWPRTRELFEAELKPTPGVVEFLTGLATKRCVASSSNPDRIRFSLALTGLARFFDSIFSTHEVAHGKPAPDIFLYAAAKSGVAPEETLVIEDSIPGVLGAKAAGARVIGYAGGAHIGPDHSDRLIEAGAEFVARDWVSVQRLLAKG